MAGSAAAEDAAVEGLDAFCLFCSEAAEFQVPRCAPGMEWRYDKHRLARLGWNGGVPPRPQSAAASNTYGCNLRYLRVAGHYRIRLQGATGSGCRARLPVGRSPSRYASCEARSSCRARPTSSPHRRCLWFAIQAGLTSACGSQYRPGSPPLRAQGCVWCFSGLRGSIGKDPSDTPPDRRP